MQCQKRTLWGGLVRAPAENDDRHAVADQVGRSGRLAPRVLPAPVVRTAVVAEIARLRGWLARAVLAGALTSVVPFAALAPQAAGAAVSPFVVLATEREATAASLASREATGADSKSADACELVEEPSAGVSRC